MTTAIRRRQKSSFPGLYRARVVDAIDPQATRRVQVSFPWSPRSPATWAVTIRDLAVPLGVGDEVLVGFDAGRLTHPYVVGLLTSAEPRPVELADENGNAIRLSPAGVEITTSAELRVNGSMIRLAATSLTADTAIADFAGVVKSTTLITDSVIASSYSPGVGNVQ